MGKSFEDMTPEELAAARGDFVEDESDKDEDELPPEDEDDADAESEDEGDEGDEDDQDDEADDAEDDAEDEDPAEDEDEDLESDSDDADDEEDEDEEPKSKKHFIPKSRYDSVAQRNKELQARLDALESEQATEAQQQARSDREKELNDQIDSLDEKINEALLDGEAEEATKLRREQRAVERELFKLESTETSKSEANNMREQMRLDLTIDQIEADFPQLNPKDEKAFDQALVDQIQELREAYDATGKYSPSQSLLKAVQMFVKDEPAAEDIDAGDEPPAKPKKNAKEVVAKRKKKAVEKAVDAAKKQPPNTDDVGEDSDKGGITKEIDPSRLSEADFDKLPAETLRRLRGDYLA